MQVANSDCRKTAIIEKPRLPTPGQTLPNPFPKPLLARKSAEKPKPLNWLVGCNELSQIGR
jgi:hypothetical protein